MIRPLAAYAISRVLVAVVALEVGRRDIARGVDPGAGPWRRLREELPQSFAALGRWDAAWYSHLVTLGYPNHHGVPGAQKALAFFPLLPILARWTSSVTPLTPAGAGIVVSLIAGALAILLIWQVVDGISGSAAADRACSVLAFFPGAVVFSMAYSEGLLVAGAAATMLALRRRRWVLAGVIAGVTTLSRPNGAAVVAMCAVAAFVAIRERREWRALVAPLLAPAGIVGFFIYLAVHTGWRLAWFRSQRKGWHDSFSFDGAAVHHIHALWGGGLAGFGPSQLNPLMGLAGLAFVGFSAYLLVRWKPPATIVAYTVVSMALALGSQRVGARPRMILAAFPLLLAVGVRFTGRTHAIIVGVSAVLSCVVALLFFNSLALTP